MDLIELSLGHRRFHQPVFCLLVLFLPLSINQGGNRSGEWVLDRWVGSPSKSFQFIMFTSVHGKNKTKNKAMVTEGNSTTPGIHGPQHEEGKYIHTVRLRVKGPGVR